MVVRMFAGRILSVAAGTLLKRHGPLSITLPRTITNSTSSTSKTTTPFHPLSLQLQSLVVVVVVEDSLTLLWNFTKLRFPPIILDRQAFVKEEPFANASLFILRIPFLIGRSTASPIFAVKCRG